MNLASQRSVCRIGAWCRMHALDRLELTACLLPPFFFWLSLRTGHLVATPYQPLRIYSRGQVKNGLALCCVLVHPHCTFEKGHCCCLQCFCCFYFAYLLGCLLGCLQLGPVMSGGLWPIPLLSHIPSPSLLFVCCPVPLLSSLFSFAVVPFLFSLELFLLPLSSKAHSFPPLPFLSPGLGLECLFLSSSSSSAPGQSPHNTAF